MQQLAVVAHYTRPVEVVNIAVAMQLLQLQLVAVMLQFELTDSLLESVW